MALKGLIVSCQAAEGDFFYGLKLMGHMAAAAEAGGACAVRADFGELDDVKKSCSLPVIALYKRVYPSSEVYITPTLNELMPLVATGAEYIAMDATARTRPENATLPSLYSYARKNSKAKLVADVSTEAEAEEAEALGFDYIAGTLRGYTRETVGIVLPDFAFLEQVVKRVKVPVIAEGGFWETGQLERLRSMGITSVCVGSAVTRPREIVKRLSEAFGK